jgi:glutathione synthase/RimK-type ligase-like ATP-grasp enzyme
MKEFIILTDEESEFLISKADFKNFTSMDIDKIKTYFLAKNYNVKVCKFSELDLSKDYLGRYILYQTSEASGSFYKRYIEDLIYFLEKQGAIVMPKHELLKAHHDKIFMELIKSKFVDTSLKTLKSMCYGSWVDAQNYNYHFPVVIKQASSSGGAGVFLAKNRKEYIKLTKKAGNILIAPSVLDLFINYIKIAVKKLIKYFLPSKSKYVQYNTAPVSTSLIVQNFIEGLNGDYKVLIFGRKYYSIYRKNRDNDFRASGSGKFFEVPEKVHEGLFNFAKKITTEIDFPIFGIDIGFDGKEYHLVEFQMIHLGPSALQRSKFWHEYHDDKWIRYEGVSDLEQEFSRAIDDYINFTCQET